MANNVFFEDLQVGDEGPTFVRKTDLMSWNMYAAVNDEFLYIHMDDDAGRAAGQGGAFGMGNLRWSYVFNALRNWLGDEAEIREVGLQFRAINHKNDVLSTYLKVVEKTAGTNLVRFEVNVLNQNGDKTAPGHAVVALPSMAAQAERRQMDGNVI